MTPYPGAASVTPGFATSTKIDLNQIGEARNSMLGIKLDQVSRVIWGGDTGDSITGHVVTCRCLILCRDRQWWILKVTSQTSIASLLNPQETSSEWVATVVLGCTLS